MLGVYVQSVLVSGCFSPKIEDLWWFGVEQGLELSSALFAALLELASGTIVNGSWTDKRRWLSYNIAPSNWNGAPRPYRPTMQRCAVLCDFGARIEDRGCSISCSRVKRVPEHNPSRDHSTGWRCHSAGAVSASQY